MAVIVGSARIDENGEAHGGKAGDQTGKEVSTQNWYKHSKGWRVLRPKNASHAAKIAACMKAACANPYIGYDQYQRLTLYNAAEQYGFDCSKVSKKVETDCSALVRVCLAYAGIKVGNFRTTNQASIMLATGLFVELTGSKYTGQSTYLKAGDVLVTKTQGHTVVVLSDGSKAAGDNVTVSDTATGTLRKGSKGAQVTKMQKMLIALGYDLGNWGADGSFGGTTEKAVKAFQKDKGLEVDGVYGPKTHETLLAAYTAKDAQTNVGKKSVRITGGTVNIRTAPNTKTGEIIGVAKRGSKFDFGGQKSADGWYLIDYLGRNAWVSGAYSELVD